MAMGLIVVLISGGFDISFAVAASAVQYVAFYLLGVSPYAFKMIVGAFILFAILMSNLSFGKRLAWQ